MPRLLDLFCGAGGAAMGYHRAGFEVVGVDNRPQPRYPFEFYEADALTFPLDGFDAIHASPPCQAFTTAGAAWRGKLGHEYDRHPDYIVPVRERLRASGLPYVIENVPGAPLVDPVQLCGLSLGLNVRRHRLFESSVALMVPPCRDHLAEFLCVFGGGARRRAHQTGRAGNGPIIRRGTATLAEGQAAMGIDWMTRAELSESIPPAYTEVIGAQLLTALAFNALHPSTPKPPRNRGKAVGVDGLAALGGGDDA